MNTSESIGIGTVVCVRTAYGRTPKTLEDELARWNEYKITGETRVSWIAKYGFNFEIKIDKKTLQVRGEDKIAWSKDEIVAAWKVHEFLADHKYRIVEKVRECRDVEILKRVAELVGYTEHAK